MNVVFLMGLFSFCLIFISIQYYETHKYSKVRYNNDFDYS